MVESLGKTDDGKNISGQVGRADSKGVEIDFFAEPVFGWTIDGGYTYTDARVREFSATDALLRLHLDGFDQVFVMPTFLLDGVEMSMLRDEVRTVSQFFKEIKVGNPVLYKLDDFHAVADLLTKQSPAKDEAVLFVGHGNEYASTGAYTMLGQIMQQKGNFMVGTIEGWPDLESSVAMVNPKKFKRVQVIPLLLASGVHVREDIDGEWRPALEEKGFQVQVSYHGLGKDKAFRNLILAHLEELLK